MEGTTRFTRPDRAAVLMRSGKPRVAASPPGPRSRTGRPPGPDQNTNGAEAPLHIPGPALGAVGLVSLGVFRHGHANYEIVVAVGTPVIVSWHGSVARRCRKKVPTYSLNIHQDQTQIHPPSTSSSPFRRPGRSRPRPGHSRSSRLPPEAGSPAP